MAKTVDMPTARPKAKQSIHFFPEELEKLEYLSEVTGRSKTEMVNRAVSFYAHVMEQKGKGRKFYSADDTGNDVIQLVLW